MYCNKCGSIMVNGKCPKCPPEDIFNKKVPFGGLIVFIAVVIFLFVIGIFPSIKFYFVGYTPKNNTTYGITVSTITQNNSKDNISIVSQKALSRDEILQIIKSNANSEWKDDYQMVKYEIDLQTKAFEWVESQREYPEIMKRAKNEWGHDYQMVKYEYELQVKAYKAIN